MKVVHCKKDSYDVYIGRPSKWCNPYSLAKYTREEAIDLYRKHLHNQLRMGRITKEDLLSLDGKTLGCWCKPLPCHGDVIVSAVEWAKRK